ncbi:MAG: SDR family NAD(P)-dependent oxidoreductase [Caldilineaceae bacterium]
MAEALEAELQRHGAQPILVYPGAQYRQVEPQRYVINPACKAEYTQLLQTVPTLQGIFYLWPVASSAVTVGSDLVATAQESCEPLLYLVQSLLDRGAMPATLRLVTRAAQAVQPTDKVTNFAQATLWGMGKVIGLEHSELNCHCIDLAEFAEPTVEAAALVQEVMAATKQPGETQVALRNGTRYVARLTRHQLQPSALPTEPYRLDVRSRGTLDNLQLLPHARRVPGAGEIELQVHATGLNFRDVLNVLGLYPGDPGAPGGECAGVVVAVGADVTDFAVGDRVMGIAAGAFSQYVTGDAQLFTRIPARLTYAAAATIPSVFLTVHYCLHYLARIQPGDRVLIHAATGGVGMAAIQIAQRAGAEIYGTASPGKQELLRKLGVSHVYNSRTLNFAEQILADTDGQGVDIVLNSLTSEGFIEKNLAVLAPNGRFVEISKRDVWDEGAVAAARPDVAYSLVDLAATTREEPALIQQMYRELTPHFASGALQPLPQTRFPIHEAVDAFRLMQQGKHTGKIVITQPVAEQIAIRADGTYLVTGGLGGLGLQTALWLVDQGARHLLLLGRSHPQPAAQQQLAALAANGVTVTVAQADVTDRARLYDLLSAIDERYPLRGMIHSAGVLDDGALVQQEWSRFHKVLAPKVQGAWHLHTLAAELSAQVDLDFFVLYSSAAGLMGSRGQANHAAANAFLDALAHYRAAQGLPARSINWGAWSEVGAAAEKVAREAQQMQQQGIGIISPTQGVTVLGALLEQGAAQVGVIPINWRHFSRQAANVPFYAALYHAPVQVEQTGGDRVDWVTQFRTLSPAEQREQVQHYLRALVARTLATNPEQVDDAQPLITMGIDSLMAVELRNQIQQATGVTVPVTNLLDGASLAALAAYLGEQLQTMPPEEQVTGTVASAQNGTQPAGLSTANAVSDADLLSTLTIDEDGETGAEEVIELTL